MNSPLRSIVGHPVTIGFAAFVAARIALSGFVGERVCRDGWHSYSIGARGACSWHGGVGGLNHGSWVFPLAIVIGIAIGVWRANAGTRAPSEPEVPAPKPERDTNQPARAYKTQEQVQANLDAFFASRKAANKKSPPG
jgi:hypothetical protein